MDFDNYSREDLIDYIKMLQKQLDDTKLGLYFERKKIPENIVQKCSENVPVLVHVPEKDIIHGGSDNILIEGDNFQVLYSLSLIYPLGIADVIYIDPPYNTGSESGSNKFMYNDKFVDVNDEYYHSKWLNFMEARLSLANKLLKEDGVIFISIDNGEQAHLKLLCDQIFGEDSFVTTLHVEMSITQGMKVKTAKKGNIVKNGEFVLVYSKNGNKTIGLKPLLDPTEYDSHYSSYLVEKDGYYEEIPLRDALPSEILYDLKKFDGLLDKKGALSNSNIPEAYRLSKKFRNWINDHASSICRTHDTIDIDSSFSDMMLDKHVYKYSSDERDYLIAKHTNGKIYQKILLSDKIAYADDFYRTYGPTNIRGDWWPGFYLDMGNVEKEGGVDFPNGKKPVRLIKQLIKFSAPDDAVVLDFFAGSGTTAEAVLDLNKEDGGTRRFILCTNNENNIMSNICYPRVKTVLTGKKLDGSYYSEGLLGSVRYYSAGFVSDSSLKEQTKYNLAEQCDGLLCILEDCFDRCNQGQSYNIYLNTKLSKSLSIFNDTYDDKQFDEMLNKIKLCESKENIVYYFSLDSEIDSNIEKKVLDVIPNAIVKPIPSKLYENYKKIADDIRRKY